jgi:hypothetical protein
MAHMSTRNAPEGLLSVDGEIFLERLGAVSPPKKSATQKCLTHSVGRR